MVAIILIRHGQSGGNAMKLLQGQDGNAVGLTELGIDQARVTGRHLRARYPEVSMIVRSQLRRVAETSAPAEHEYGLSAIVDERVAEIDFGWWSGKSRAEVEELAGSEWLALESGEDIPRGGGETFADLTARVGDALEDLRQRVEVSGSTAPVLVFTHGGTIRAAVTLAGLETGAPPFAKVDPDNCSITELEATSDELLLRRWNCVGHLVGAHVQP